MLSGVPKSWMKEKFQLWLLQELGPCVLYYAEKKEKVISLKFLEAKS